MGIILNMVLNKMPIYGLLLTLVYESYLGGAFSRFEFRSLGWQRRNIEFVSVYREVTGQWADLARVLLIPCAMRAYRNNVDGMPGWPL